MNTDTNISHEEMNVHPIISTLANMMNYLNVSFYEGLFTYKHEQARAKLNELYDSLTLSSLNTQSSAPSIDAINEFYNNVNYLQQVTDTDDIDYHSYMRKLYIYCRTTPSIKTTDNKNDAYHNDVSVNNNNTINTKINYYYDTDSDSDTTDDDIDWLKRERDDWTESIRLKKL